MREVEHLSRLYIAHQFVMAEVKQWYLNNVFLSSSGKAFKLIQELVWLLLLFFSFRMYRKDL